MQTISDWLAKHNLSRYSQAFSDNGISIDLLGELDADDLKEIGLSLGDRKRFQIAVRNEMHGDAVKAESSPSVQATTGAASVVLAGDANLPSAIPVASPASASPPSLPAAAVDSAGDREGEIAAAPGAGRTSLPSAEVTHTSTVTPGAERRQLTVMFVDLVGSTTLSQQLDPEDMGQVVRAYQVFVGRCITVNGGYVSRYMGDGVLAYFGWPAASEDDATHAVNAALEITAGISKLTTPDGQSLSCRCGIATGLVVVGELIGEGPSQEHAVVGETPNLAARLQGFAEVNNIVVSDSTRRLVGNHFEFQALGSQDLKGIRDPVPVFSVVRAKSVESRFHASRSDTGLPLVGRRQQLEQLQFHWQQSVTGRPSHVLLQGEPGIGKSRLLHAFIDSLESAAYRRVLLQCDPLRKDSALFPVTRFLMRRAGIATTDAQTVRLQKLRAITEFLPPIEVSGRSSSILSLLAALPGLGGDSQAAELTQYSGEQIRNLTLHAVAFIMLEQCDATGNTTPLPVLLVLEDAHWIDPTTLELLSVVAQVSASRGVLLLVTARPEFEPATLPFEDLSSIQLPRLGADACRQVVNSMADSSALPDHILNEIVARTDGVPLFAEELTKTVLESRAFAGSASDAGEQAIESLEIPSSLHDSLMSRLDRLQSPREVAQTAACLGREFSFDLLLAISPVDKAGLINSLQTLCEAGLIYGDTASSYSFKHALVRDTAYESLLKSKRQQIHLQIGQVLQKEFSELLSTQPELAAYHFRRGASYIQASRYWHLAAKLALQRVANREAIAHASSGLKCLELAGESQGHVTRHYELLFARGMGYMAVHGYAADTVSSNFTAALELATAMDDSERYSQAARGVVTADIVSSRFEAGLALADKMLDKAETDMQQFYALRMQGQIYLWQARFEESHHCFERAIELYDPGYQSALSQWDDGVLCTGFSGITLTCLGQTDLGEQRHQQSVELANQLRQPFSQCQAMESWITSILLRGDDFSAQLETFRALADTHNMVFFQACAQMYLGIQTIRNGSPAAGIKVLTEGLKRYQDCQSKLGVPKWMTYVAEGYIHAGEQDQAVQLLDSAKIEMNKAGNEYFRAEWARIKAESLFSIDKEASQAHFEESIDLARAQGAGLFELTATMGLVRLQQTLGQEAEAKAKAKKQLCDVVSAFSGQQPFVHLANATALLE